MKKIFLLISFFLLTSCSLQPVFKKSGNCYKELSEIHLEPIESIEGVEFYNQFLNYTPPQHDLARYNLRCKVKIRKDFNIIQRKADILRHKLTILVEFELWDNQQNKLIAKDGLTKFSSYTTGLLPYSNYELERNTINALSIAAAEEVRRRIIYLIKNAE